MYKTRCIFMDHGVFCLLQPKVPGTHTGQRLLWRAGAYRLDIIGICCSLFPTPIHSPRPEWTSLVPRADVVVVPKAWAWGILRVRRPCWDSCGALRCPTGTQRGLSDNEAAWSQVILLSYWGEQFTNMSATPASCEAASYAASTDMGGSTGCLLTTLMG